MKIFLFALSFVLAAAVSHAGSLSTYKVTFKTLTCAGSKGMASVDADHIIKIESQKCDQGEPVKEVYQILVQGDKSAGAYRVFTTTEQEANRIQKSVDDFQNSKMRSIEKGDRIIIDKDRH